MRHQLVLWFAFYLIIGNNHLFSQTSFLVIKNDSLKTQKKVFKDGLKMINGLDIDKVPAYFTPSINNADSSIIIDIKDLSERYPQALTYTGKDSAYVQYELLVPVLINAIQRLYIRQIELEDKLSSTNTVITNQKIMYDDKIKDLLYKIDLLNSEIESFRSNFLKK